MDSAVGHQPRLVWIACARILPKREKANRKQDEVRKSNQICGATWASDPKKCKVLSELWECRAMEV